MTRHGEPLVVGAPAAPGTVEVARGGEKMRLRFLNPPGVGVRYVTYPGAESYRAYLQADTPRAEATVLVTLCEFGATTAQAVVVKVAGGVVDLSCQVAGRPTRILLTLAGDGGESPELTVSQERRKLLDRKDLAVPTNTPG